MINNIMVLNANANNLKNVSTEIKFGELTVCVGPSGSGKSSFAYDTLIMLKDCTIKNYPEIVKSVSQRIATTSEKMAEIKKLLPLDKALIVIDEPLAGMMQEEAIECSKTIKQLAEKNAVVVVEHRKEIFEFANKILLFGPGSGPDGGNILKTLTGSEYIKTLPTVEVRREKNKSNKKIQACYSEFRGIKNYKVELTLNAITSVIGPANSGKTTYLDALFAAFDKSVGASERRADLIDVKNKNYIRRPHIIDATPVAKNSKSTVATYYGVSNFFKDKDMNITVKEALNIYQENVLIIRRLKYLENLGLDYLKLNQSSYSLSGGECQRIKLAKLLNKKLGDRSIYIFDNPVRGLGNANIGQVMLMFDELVKNNNTILIAENDSTALQYVDYTIEL